MPPNAPLRQTAGTANNHNRLARRANAAECATQAEKYVDRPNQRENDCPKRRKTVPSDGAFDYLLSRKKDVGPLAGPGIRMKVRNSIVRSSGCRRRRIRTARNPSTASSSPLPHRTPRAARRPERGSESPRNISPAVAVQVRILRCLLSRRDRRQRTGDARPQTFREPESQPRGPNAESGPNRIIRCIIGTIRPSDHSSFINASIASGFSMGAGSKCSLFI